MSPQGVPPIKRQLAEEHTHASVFHAPEFMEGVLNANR
jgi:hypothetical protein